MREPTFWILTALASAPRHGYGVIQEAGRLSGGRVTLQAGTLYAALDRLTAEGLVEPDRDEVVDGRTRRYYRLTSDGVAALDAETARMRADVDAATAQLAARRRFGLGPAGAQRTATSRPADGRRFGPPGVRRAAW
jgi:PadR family transcriptional regulator PadR